VAALTLLNGLLLLFTWAGVGRYLWWLAHQKGWHDANLLLYPLLLAMALMALSAGPVEAIQMRFRLPATAFLAVIAAVGLVRLVPRPPCQRRHETKTLIVIIAAMIALSHFRLTL
jgi:hypothetical protein